MPRPKVYIAAANEVQLSSCAGFCAASCGNWQTKFCSDLRRFFGDSIGTNRSDPVQFSAGTFNHIYGVYHCVVSNSSFSG